MLKNKTVLKNIFRILIVFFVITFLWQFTKVPSTDGNWQIQLAQPSIATFDGDLVTVKNVRNFRYGGTEKDMIPGYYDRTYNLNEVKQVWFISEPFDERQLAAHTFLSFEFNSGDFLAISIEARKLVGQDYNILKGFFRTYPLMYIAADERDVVMLRTNIRKDNVYLYPVKLTKPEHARMLLEDMLKTMNGLVTNNPRWYHSYFANCTSSIAKHVNKLDPGRISLWSPELFFTGNSDVLALENGVLNVGDISIEEARQKYKITEISPKIGDVEDYSKLIRDFK